MGAESKTPTRLAALQADLTALIAAQNAHTAEYERQRAAAGQYDKPPRALLAHAQASILAKARAAALDPAINALRRDIASLKDQIEDQRMQDISNTEFFRRLSLTPEQMAAVDDTADLEA